jgi:hypothetical protein
MLEGISNIIAPMLQQKRSSETEKKICLETAFFSADL